MTTSDHSPDSDDVNVVHLRGRVSGEPREITLPSGDPLVAVRVVVPRTERRRRSRPGATVDTLDCVAWTSRARRALGRLRPDDMVAIRGAVRRRFWRGAQGTASKVEIEVARATRV